MCRPRLLLLDEPLSALDAAMREELRGELRHLLTACNIPVFLVTHDRNEALALGDELVVVSGGMVRQSGSVLEVFNHPADAAVAKIVGVETLLPGRVLNVSDGLATVEAGTTRLLALAPARNLRDVFVCIRGEDVMLQRDGVATVSVRNRLSAKVLSVYPGSPLARVELDAGFPLFAFVTRPACEELGLAVGLTVTALIKAPAIHLIARANWHDRSNRIPEFSVRAQNGLTYNYLLPDGNDQTNQRPDIVPGVPVMLSHPHPAGPNGGGSPLVNAAAFQAPPLDANGNFT